MEEMISKCKNCGSELEFVPQSDKLVCKYCKATYLLPKEKEDSKLVRSLTNGFHPSQLNKNVDCYKCKACGHSFFCANESMALSCGNCGSGDIEKTSSEGYCADGIIPFAVKKEQAQAQIISYLKSKNAMPKSMLKFAENADNIVGTFVPVWNFVFDLESKYTANANELKKDSNGVFYCVPFSVYGEDRKSIKSADESASSFENNEFLDLFDENDYLKIIPYSLEYTLGYKVDDIDCNLKDRFYEMLAAEEKKVENELQRKVETKYKDVRNFNVSTMSNDVYFNFTYVPVYVMNFNYHKKNYKIYASGTNGKVVGNAPISISHKIIQIAKLLGLGALGVLIYYLATH